jgi:hypothetical protein
MTIAETEYWVHGLCRDCVTVVLKDTVNSVFSHTIEGNVFTISLKGSDTSYSFEWRHDKIWCHDRLVIANGLKTFDEVSKQEISIVLPDKMVTVPLPPVQNLIAKTAIEITIPYSDLFQGLLRKIACMIPCQWCHVTEGDRFSFMMLNRDCYVIDVACKDCWKLL